MALAAINAGHVYHFLTKPWSKDELVRAVTRCFELRQSQTVAAKKVCAAPVRKMSVGELEMQFPGISHVKRKEGGVISLEDLEGLDDDYGEIEALLRSAQ
jgi:response regulator RpfG family c-di-GMP phosphodiesterase